MANRYWVGGTAAWDGTAGTKWSTTSGGAGGAAVPTSADDVFFNAASGVVTCTISTGNTGAKSINCTGFTGTLDGTGGISVSGSVTLVSGMTFSYAGTLTFIQSGTLTSAGKNFNGFVGVGNATATLTLGGALTFFPSRGFILTAGTLDLNGFTLTAGTFTSTSASNFVRSITFGSSNIALTSTTAGQTILDIADATNFTCSGTGGFTRNMAATSTISVGSTAGVTSTNAVNLIVNGGSSALTITTQSSFKTINFSGSSCAVTGAVVLYGDLTLGSGAGAVYTSFEPTFAATANLISSGKTLGNTSVDAAGSTITIGSALTLGASNTFTLTNGAIDLNGFNISTGIFSSTGSGSRSIAFGSSNIALTSTTAATTVLDMANATNFTYTGTGSFTRNMSATATVVFGTTAGSITNAPNLRVNAGASALTITANSWFNDLIFTGNTSTVTASTLNITGDLTLAVGGTYTSVAPRYRDTGTIASVGKTLSSLTIDGSGITATCADALTLSGALTFTLGTLKLKDSVTSSVGSLVTTGTTLKYLESSSTGMQATISDASGTNTVTYLSIQDSNATGGATFTAISSTNVNAGNNTGWIFPSSGNFLTFFM